MRDNEIQLIKQINDARFQPRIIAQKIRVDLKPKFRGTELYAYNQRIQTFEGEQVLDDMLQYMAYLKTLPPLTPSFPLSNAATQIAKSKGESGMGDNQKPKRIYDLVKMHGDMDGKVGELICMSARQPQEITSYFLMDDGLATRKRRRMLLDPNYKYIGIGSSSHIVYGNITVILLAEKVTPLENQHGNVKYYESQVREVGDGY